MLTFYLRYVHLTSIARMLTNSFVSITLRSSNLACSWPVEKYRIEIKMSLNPQYETIGNSFVQQYYTLFDDSMQRPNLANLYSADLSMMSFEGEQFQGSLKIMEKFNSLSFKKINRVITAVDTQPMFDGGILIVVLGQLKTDDDPSHGFNQTFALKPLGDSFFIQHEIFRLSLHHMA